MTTVMEINAIEMSLKHKMWRKETWPLQFLRLWSSMTYICSRPSHSLINIFYCCDCCFASWRNLLFPHFWLLFHHSNKAAKHPDFPSIQKFLLHDKFVSFDASAKFVQLYFLFYCPMTMIYKGINYSKYCEYTWHYMYNMFSIYSWYTMHMGLK